MNRTLFITLLCVLVYTGAIGQTKYAWSLDAGANMPLFQDKSRQEPAAYGSKTHVSPTASFKLISTDKKLNYGIALCYDSYHFTYGSGHTYETSANTLSDDHKSSFLYLGPIAAVAMDHHKIVHLLLMPAIGFFAGGNEKGAHVIGGYQNHMYVVTTDDEFNTNKYINRITGRINIDLQTRIHLHSSSYLIADLGYSFMVASLSNVLDNYKVHPGLLSLKLGYMHNLLHKKVEEIKK